MPIQNDEYWYEDGQEPWIFGTIHEPFTSVTVFEPAETAQPAQLVLWTVVGADLPWNIAGPAWATAMRTGAEPAPTAGTARRIATRPIDRRRGPRFGDTRIGPERSGRLLKPRPSRSDGPRTLLRPRGGETPEHLGTGPGRRA